MVLIKWWHLGYIFDHDQGWIYCAWKNVAAKVTYKSNATKSTVYEYVMQLSVLTLWKTSKSLWVASQCAFLVATAKKLNWARVPITTLCSHAAKKNLHVHREGKREYYHGCNSEWCKTENANCDR